MFDTSPYNGSTASLPIPCTTNTPRPSRRKTAENWDDDGDFELHSSSPAKAVHKRRSSPAESWSELWDESPPGPSRVSSSRRPKAPSPLNLPFPSQPCRSPSHTLPLPKPYPSSLVISSAPDLPISPPALTYSDLGCPLPQPGARSRSNAAAATVIRNKLVKRHPSASALPNPASSPRPFTHRSSPSLPPPLPRSDSGERMPPPPVPTGLTRSKSKSKRQSTGRDGVRVSNSPFSPSQDAMREVEQVKRPGFWKRLSVAPTERHKTEHRRRRSSSAGDQLPRTPTTAPALPPFPPNLSSTSTASKDSATSSSSNRSVLYSILHRSASSLSRRASPPSSYPYRTTDPSSASSTSLHSPQTSPLLGRTFSRGFHLPSPSPRSPYHPATGLIPGEGGTPPLPHSSSFIALPLPYSNSFPIPRIGDSDTETEKDGATPRRKRRPRPVSALPAARTSSRIGWDGEVWSEANNDFTPSSPRIAHANGFTASTSSTLKRLGSLSKKHGRRLSGGFKFGTSSSSSSIESNARPLETVVGSPSKIDNRENIRAGSVSAPSSVIKPIDSTIRKEDKERRRQIAGEFVIPREFLDKQKGVKQGIDDFKSFASRAEVLKGLLALHADLQRRVGPEHREIWEALESEFAESWEMAVVLIDAANTGRESSQSSPRKPRAYESSNPRTISLPESTVLDPASASSPPGASPDQWRGSTGRQEFSKRKRELLQSMLSPRPTVPQGRSVVTIPSRSESTYRVPSEIPLAQMVAEDLVRPLMPKRRSSRAGLAGLKEFLRSLKSGSVSTPSKVTRNQPATAKSSGRPPMASVPLLSSPPCSSNYLRRRSPSRPRFSRAPSSSASSPPTSPTESYFPRSSFSALARDPSPPTNNKKGIPRTSTIRNIFSRTTSGLWVDTARAPFLPRRSTDEPRFEEEDTVDGLPNDARRSPRWSRDLRGESKSRIVGLGWPVPQPDSRQGDENEGDEEEDEEGDLVISITPENLPTLLVYLKHCLRHLAEWKRRVGELDI